MLLLKKVFNLGCVPEDNKQNFTAAYEPPKVETKKPQILCSTLLCDPSDETAAVDTFPSKEKLLKNAKSFVKLRFKTLSYVEEELKTMYSVLENCINERVAMHIWAISKASRGTQKTLEECLMKNYMNMLKNPEWNVEWSKYRDLTDHPYFPKFYQCQLKSDFIYRNNSHEIFMRMKFFLNHLLFHSKAQEAQIFYSMLQSMKGNLNEFMVRDLLVLYYHSNTTLGTEQMEDYLMAKYQFKEYQKVPEDLNTTNSCVKDSDVEDHPYYMEYYLAKMDLKDKYKFKFDPFYSSYKQMAEHWIDFRLKVQDGEKLPYIVKEMYRMLENNLSSNRAYELFLLSQYRMDMKKVRRMEAYLSEKYRPHLSNPDLASVEVVSEEENEDSSFFALHHSQLYEIIKTSNMKNTVYTQEMIDTVVKMLTKKKKVILEVMAIRKLTKKEKHHGKLLDFLYNRPNEEKVRELYAMHTNGVEDWEDVFYEKYKFMIEVLKDFDVVKKFSV